MHVRVRSGASGRVCAQERTRRSRRAWASLSACRARPGRGLWEVWAAGADWVSSAVVSGTWWRSDGWWRLLEASLQRACALVTLASEGESKVRCGLVLTAM
jgi:hypothetical protein